MPCVVLYCCNIAQHKHGCNMKTYSVERFTFENGVYSVEASELGWRPGEYSTELGITHRSGVVSRFVLREVSHGPEKDIEYFKFGSVLGKHHVIVFND